MNFFKALILVSFLVYAVNCEEEKDEFKDAVADETEIIDAPTRKIRNGTKLDAMCKRFEEEGCKRNKIEKCEKIEKFCDCIANCGDEDDKIACVKQCKGKKGGRGKKRGYGKKGKPNRVSKPKKEYKPKKGGKNRGDNGNETHKMGNGTRKMGKRTPNIVCKRFEEEGCKGNNTEKCEILEKFCDCVADCEDEDNKFTCVKQCKGKKGGRGHKGNPKRGVKPRKEYKPKKGGKANKGNGTHKLGNGMYKMGNMTRKFCERFEEGGCKGNKTEKCEKMEKFCDCVADCEDEDDTFACIKQCKGKKGGHGNTGCQPKRRGIPNKGCNSKKGNKVNKGGI